MGLKYVETMKSIILFVLVAISVTLTFSIWTYTPTYDTIESSSTVDISIADKKQVEQLIHPYKVVYAGSRLLGTHEQVRLDELVQELHQWSIVDLSLERERFTSERVERTLAEEHSFILSFFGEVPFAAYENSIPLKDEHIPEGTFDRMIVSLEEDHFVVHFINRQHEYFYTAVGQTPNMNRTLEFFNTWSNELEPFVQIPNDRVYVATSEERIQMSRDVYYQEEINPTRFRDALFSDPNAVRRNLVGATKEEYADNHALMTVDTERKLLDFVYPLAESQEVAIPSELMFNSIDFINEHGGWTDDFRYVGMNPMHRRITFQLFVQGFPVFGETEEMTKITEQYGQGRAFRYVRPYYSFDSTLLIERSPLTIPSGSVAIEQIRQNVELNDQIEDLTPGYQMIQDFERRLFVLEPAWFYLENGTWHRYELGERGDQHGLG